MTLARKRAKDRLRNSIYQKLYARLLYATLQRQGTIELTNPGAGEIKLPNTKQLKQLLWKLLIKKTLLTEGYGLWVTDFQVKKTR